MKIEFINTLLIVGVAILTLFRDSIGAFSKKKAENIATKQDIAKITEITENVKLELKEMSSFNHAKKKELYEKLFEIQSYKSKAELGKKQELIFFKDKLDELVMFLDTYKSIFHGNIKMLEILVDKINNLYNSNLDYESSINELFVSIHEVLSKNLGSELNK